MRFLDQAPIWAEEIEGQDPLTVLYNVGVSTEEFLSNFDVIYSYMFTWPTIQKVVIPPNVKSIDSGAFDENESINQIILPPTIKLQSNCCSKANVLEEITIPGKAELMDGGYQFSFCDELKKVVIEEGIESIPPGCFMDCENLEEIYIPKSVGHIDETSFCGIGDKLKKLVIPKQFEPDVTDENLIDHLWRDFDSIVTFI